MAGMDIIKPKGNEEEMIAMAKKLGNGKLIFAYEGKVLRQPGCVICRPGDVQKQKDATICFSAGDDRKIFERIRPDVIMDLEYQEEKDFMNAKNSGLNQVLAKIAHDKGIAVGFSIIRLIKLPPGKRARIIARIKQNIRLCRKYRVEMVAATFAQSLFEMRGEIDLSSFLIALGMTPAEAKNSLNAKLFK